MLNILAVHEDQFKETEIGSVPEDWSIQSLGELFWIQQGKALSRKKDRGVSPHRFLRTSNVFWGKIDLSTVDTMDFTEEEVQAYALRPGDLLVCEGGDIGRTAMWKEGSGVYCYQNHLHRLRPKRENVHPPFYMYWLQAALLILNLYQGIANRTTIANLSQSRLAQFQLPVPPLPEQRRIAHVLNTIQREIGIQDDLITAARELKRSLMHRLFTYGVTTGPVPSKETEMGELPENWEVIRLGEVVRQGNGSIQTGPFGTLLHASDYVSQGYPVVMPKDLTPRGRISTEGIACIGREDYQRLERYHLQAGDLLLARRGEIGRCGLVTQKETGWVCGTGCLRIRVGDLVDPRFLAQAFEVARLRRWLTAHAIGTTMMNLSAQILDHMPLPLPTLSEQKEIVHILESVDHKITAEEDRKAALQVLFNAMLHQLMTSQIRLKDVEL